MSRLFMMYNVQLHFTSYSMTQLQEVQIPQSCATVNTVLFQISVTTFCELGINIITGPLKTVRMVANSQASRKHFVAEEFLTLFPFLGDRSQNGFAVCYQTVVCLSVLSCL